jgi:hypothetical protein
MSTGLIIGASRSPLAGIASIDVAHQEGATVTKRVLRHPKVHAPAPMMRYSAEP